MSIEVLKRGLLTTVQDMGRTGYGKYGVSTSGVMDGYAYKLANWLVGNPGSEAVLELTWSGFSLRFLQDSLVSITGADLSPECGGIAVPMWRPVLFREGSELVFRRPVSGSRSYLAISGGIDVPVVMGSRSTYIRAGIGGLNGRALESGDILHAGKSGRTAEFSSVCHQKDAPFQAVRWSAAPRRSYIQANQIVRVTRGRQFADFRSESIDQFYQGVYTVKPESDRMGFRLSGPTLVLEEPKEYLSEGVVSGTVQVPADGQPIILMADRQTLGGYPKIAQVATVDLPRIAQLAPGGSLRFLEITPYESEMLYMQQVQAMRALQCMINCKLKEGFHDED